MTELRLIMNGEQALLAGAEGAPLLEGAAEVRALIEACWAQGAQALLLYPANLTPGFFDLSSGEAGHILQQLQNYRIRLAVVCPPGSVRFSERFAELVSESRRGRDFGVFAGRDAALAWLRA